MSFVVMLIFFNKRFKEKFFRFQIWDLTPNLTTKFEKTLLSILSILKILIDEIITKTKRF